MHRSIVTGVALACAALFAQAAPTAAFSTPTVLAEYTGSGPLGTNAVNVDDTVFFLYESTGTYLGQAVDAWLVFFDPNRDEQLAAGTIDFDAPIVDVLDEQLELIATAGFGKPGVAYDYSSAFIGLERDDIAATSFSGSVLTIGWASKRPGDYVRVLTSAVPEPQTFALALAGLAGLAWAGQRRRA